ncbi:MAG: TatD family deoxyribonuclease [Chloroflexi bacterium AL-W]|nr:TatD family deoxyribonuclease [Chloroflexi bacterium AL-N1]NOK69181.1 TatD family deoxyribonuclease [Chloroflexi bacterium AL-N10]NOK77164.1 TatD family deoxyribonuclease [Chloroflexi bacterium AL-N5]NOK83809.1 TatD family deoxyribonuclease [Chloroflexi bacterium AL-W]NOK91019.1 TatD family deoxyribonuclease [Chloroflexi bacterium AL-N15]
MSQSLQFIDTHVHLHLTQFDADRETIIEHAHTAGVQRMVEIGYDLVSSRAAVQLAEQHTELYAVVGIQPHYAAEADASWLAEIQHLAQHPKVVAIGEIGLDYYHDRAPHERQEQLFREQIALARELNLPVVIHSRDAQEDTIRILRDAACNQPGIMHSFSGDWAYAEACLEVGFYLSFSGPVTFSKATALHHVAQHAPLDRILTETDSPYLSPHPFRGKRNEPARVRLVTERIAKLRAMTVADVADTVWQNASTIFRLTD